EGGGGRPELPGRRREMIRRAGHDDRRGDGVCQRGEEAPRAKMRRGDQVAHGRHGGEGDASALALLVELLYRAVAAPLLEERLEGVEVGAACEAVLEHLETCPF